MAPLPLLASSANGVSTGCVMQPRSHAPRALVIFFSMQRSGDAPPPPSLPPSLSALYTASAPPNRSRRPSGRGCSPLLYDPQPNDEAANRRADGQSDEDPDFVCRGRRVNFGQIQGKPSEQKLSQPSSSDAPGCPVAS
ncbi:hypothetical protein CHARACLAT_012565 [Characodon lateralis]|uniref:Uncharacterized protein n=1 Tax=Characodon lateralis TaxID=208331 RepID=A0ABU7D6L6_9TELE|nr:hypothetical protein [Characodon lateralis]